ncbi:MULTISPECIES: phage terminase large subunit family protein [Methylobacterium]|uniref:Phage terminase large subunit family protein n=1 Tax=Methylobacterium marchantiae TaxID=600331 RepID=A0ABW3WUJ2_9HYPH
MTTILMKGSQIGASQAGLVFLLYCIAVGGGPTLVVAPTIAMAELYSKQRLDPIIDGCAPARAKIPPNRGKNSGNTLRLKTFPDGMVRLTGANSANALKSMPAKNAIYEEPDEFVPDLKGQGNAVEMTRRRLTTYGRRAKEFANCTPTLSSRTIIEPLFKGGDQRLHRMPCPHGCGHRTVFSKELFRFEKGGTRGRAFRLREPRVRQAYHGGPAQDGYDGRRGMGAPGGERPRGDAPVLLPAGLLLARGMGMGRHRQEDRAGRG